MGGGTKRQKGTNNNDEWIDHEITIIQRHRGASKGELSNQAYGGVRPKGGPHKKSNAPAGKIQEQTTQQIPNTIPNEP